MRGTALFAALGLPLVVAGCAAFMNGLRLSHEFAAERGITFRGPDDLTPKAFPRYARGFYFEGGQGSVHETRILGSFECPRYDFTISWSSPESAAVIGDAWLSAQRSAPKREVQTMDDWPEPWTSSFECTIPWLRPGFSTTQPQSSDLRFLRFTGRAHTQRDRDEAVRVFHSIRFKPW